MSLQDAVEPRKITGRRARRASRPVARNMPDVLQAIHDKGFITDRQFMAGAWLFREMAMTGTSGGVAAWLRPKVDVSTVSRGEGPAGWTQADERCQRVLDGLRKHERSMLQFLMTYATRPSGRRSPAQFVEETWPELNAGQDKSLLTKMSYGHLQGLLETIAELRDNAHAVPMGWSGTRLVRQKFVPRSP